MAKNVAYYDDAPVQSEPATKDLQYRSMRQLSAAFDKADRELRTHTLAAQRAAERRRALANAISDKMSSARNDQFPF